MWERVVAASVVSPHFGDEVVAGFCGLIDHTHGGGLDTQQVCGCEDDLVERGFEVFNGGKDPAVCLE